MIDDFLIVNIREYLRQGEDGEDMLRRVFSTFSCEKNADVERFLVQQSIEFTKKNQSVTYIVVTPEQGQDVYKRQAMGSAKPFIHPLTPFLRMPATSTSTILITARETVTFKSLVGDLKPRSPIILAIPKMCIRDRS